jgi:hypothetical protein
MNITIATYGDDYEAYETLGVFETPEAAKAVCNEHRKQSNGHPIQWDGMGVGTSKVQVARSRTTYVYRIETHEVRKG